MEKKEKRTFIIRAILWSLTACIAPLCFIGWRYEIFTTVSRISFSGWGIISILVLFFFLMALVKYIKAGFVEYSMVKQVLNGVTKVLLPLAIVLCLCVAIRSKMDYFIQALSVILVCEAIAIPLNPFPKWIYEKTQGQYESMMDILVKKLDTKKREEK